MENHIKKELIEKSQLVQAFPNHEQSKAPSSEPRRSASVACGSSVFEVCMQVPAWASQVNCCFVSRDDELERVIILSYWPSNKFI